MMTWIIHMIVFSSPWWFFLLAFVPVWYVLMYRRRAPYFPSLQLPFSRSQSASSQKSRIALPMVAGILPAAAWIIMAVGMAGPQWIERGKNQYTEGIDIVLAMDISLSMLARDFEPDRLEASKDVAARFFRDRGTDRMGIVVFAGQPFTLCPLTADKGALITLLQQAQAGFIEDGSTAIGDGIATAINRLRESDARSKVIILLTDGENNAGNVDPLQASEIASLYGIRLYTIGVGTQGIAIGPVQIIEGNILFGPVPVEIDEKTLSMAAESTGGRYFRATNKQALEEIYKEIDRLEKSRLKASLSASRIPLYQWFAGISLLLVLATWLIRYLFAKTLP